MSDGRRNGFWLAFAAVYGVGLAAIGVLLVADPGLDAGEKGIWLGIAVLAPALAFLLAAAPLWRKSTNRVALLGGAVAAIVVAVVVTAATWGLFLPFAAVLVALAIADVNVALRLTGPRAYAARYAWLVAAIAVLLLVVGFAAPVVLAVVAVALLLWALRHALVNR